MAEQWFWTLSSEEYGNETFGPYQTKLEAEGGIARVQYATAQNPDDVIRFYTAPFIRPHACDEDCTLDETDVCTVCSVWHGSECHECKQRGFHHPDCSQWDPADYQWEE